MKKIKFPVALIGAVIAGVGALSSAFTPKPVFTQYKFFNELSSGQPSVTDKTKWIYSSTGTCSTNASEYCSVLYEQSTQPAEGAHPSSSATYVNNSVITDSYNGN